MKKSGAFLIPVLCLVSVNAFAMGKKSHSESESEAQSRPVESVVTVATAAHLKGGKIPTLITFDSLADPTVEVHGNASEFKVRVHGATKAKHAEELESFLNDSEVSERGSTLQIELHRYGSYACVLASHNGEIRKVKGVCLDRLIIDYPGDARDLKVLVNGK